jgi:hypothetical protein
MRLSHSSGSSLTSSEFLTWVLCTCLWHALCRCWRFSVSSVPPSTTGAMWWVSISSPLNSGSPHSGHFQPWFSAIVKSLVFLSKRVLPSFWWRLSQYSLNEGSSGLASPLTFMWRSMGVDAIWYRTSSLSLPRLSLVVQANVHRLPLMVLK